MTNIRGGMARINGVTFVSDCFIVTATRIKNGTIQIHTEKTLRRRGKKFRRLYDFMSETPFIRGIWNLLVMWFENWKILIAVFLLAAMVVLLSVFVFEERGAERINIPVWLLSHALFILLPKITPLGKYHAAEHQIVNAYEQGKNISLDNIKLASRVNRHCGTNLLVFIVSITIILVTLLDINSLLAGLIGISVGTEIHFNRNKVIEKVLVPFYILGSFLQFYVFTSKANEEHLEVAIASWNELIRVDKENSRL
ncbi:DUF1385 domain-containing protein [Pseudobacillus sp. 179-B 2D1 NHS]|uniref:DUF1385 domain-containing protein n=1 Tax=Pseudobacillus sp. 179-B 2D1 NHS TaxID=3374292 RepID=UPI00387A06D6